jgi:NADH:ubiquinone oxidoreductase subunit 6 (subunit J)
MTLESARKWLGIFFLLTTVIIGCYLLLFSGMVFLPLTQAEAGDCFQIIIPVLVGQVTVIFQWIAMTNNAQEDKNSLCPIPGWAIKLPPILALLIIILASIVLVIANDSSKNLSASPDTFKHAITFSATILNATTVYLVAKLFPTKKTTPENNTNRVKTWKR